MLPKTISVPGCLSLLNAQKLSSSDASYPMAACSNHEQQQLSQTVRFHKLLAPEMHHFNQHSYKIVERQEKTCRDLDHCFYFQCYCGALWFSDKGSRLVQLQALFKIRSRPL